MPIVSSTYVVDSHTQIDGRSYVVETHTDDLGAAMIAQYLAEPGANYAAIMSARADDINEQLAAAEAEGLI